MEIQILTPCCSDQNCHHPIVKAMMFRLSWKDSHFMYISLIENRQIFTRFKIRILIIKLKNFDCWDKIWEMESACLSHLNFLTWICSIQSGYKRTLGFFEYCADGFKSRFIYFKFGSFHIHGICSKFFGFRSYQSLAI